MHWQRGKQCSVAAADHRRAKESLKYDVLHEGCAESTAKSSTRYKKKAAASRIVDCRLALGRRCRVLDRLACSKLGRRRSTVETGRCHSRRRPLLSPFRQ